MGALYLVDLADKTHRGLQGRVEAGASAGGLIYGYDVVPVPESEDRGGRSINDGEAAVVIRVLTDYGPRNLSPKAIAAALNCESVLDPRGAGWSQSTINGNRARGTGVLNGEFYIGQLVWHRLSYDRDPEIGKRRLRLNKESERVRSEVQQPAHRRAGALGRREDAPGSARRRCQASNG